MILQNSRQGLCTIILSAAVLGYSISGHAVNLSTEGSLTETERKEKVDEVNEISEKDERIKYEHLLLT